MANWQDQLLQGLGSKPGLILSTIVPTEEPGIGEENTELFTISNSGIYKIWLKNIGSNPTTACTIDVKNSPLATWKTIVSTTAQFTTISADVKGFLLASDDTIDPTALAPGEEWNGAIDCTKFQQFRITIAGDTRIQLGVS